MNLDFTFTVRKKIKCPHCGEVFGQMDVASITTCGQIWFDFLERLGYNVPTNACTSRGGNMILTDNEMWQLRMFVDENEFYNKDSVNDLVTSALTNGDKIIMGVDRG